MLPLLLLLPFLLLVMDLLGIGLALMLLMLAMALKVDHQNNHLLDRDQPLSQQRCTCPCRICTCPCRICIWLCLRSCYLWFGCWICC
nr:hypothetical protein Q903MT_gene1028 [Picea sitchensis]